MYDSQDQPVDLSNSSSLTLSSIKSQRACFSDYGRTLAAVCITSFSVSLALSFCVMFLDTITYMAYCLALHRDQLFERAADFSLVPFFGSLVVSTVAWAFFYSGACCLNFEAESYTTKAITAVLLLLNFFTDTAIEVMRNYILALDHSMDSMQDYLYAKLISLAIVIGAVSTYVNYYGVNQIHGPIIDFYTTIQAQLTKSFGVDCDQFCENSICFFSKNKSVDFALSSSDAGDDRSLSQSLIEEGGEKNDPNDGEDSVINPIIRSYG